MRTFEKYEKLMEEFSYKAYAYAGNTIKLDVTNIHSGSPAFVMNSPELEKKLNAKQKEELKEILSTAMVEVMKIKPENKEIKEFLGWN